MTKTKLAFAQEHAYALDAELFAASWERMILVAALDKFTGRAPDHLRIMAAPIILEMVATHCPKQTLAE